jgi:hypothetical protein
MPVLVITEKTGSETMTVVLILRFQYNERSYITETLIDKDEQLGSILERALYAYSNPKFVSSINFSRRKWPWLCRGRLNGMKGGWIITK